MEMMYLNEPEKLLQNKVCVFGQGFVGLPLTLSYALRGVKSIGVDIDEFLISNINKGITFHTEKFHGITIGDILKKQISEGKYFATTDGAKAMRESVNIIVTVGIPIKDSFYEMKYLEKSCRIIGKNLKKEDLIIIRSTVIPGTTEDFILPILEEESGMKAGNDFYLAYVSERISEGNAFEEFENMPSLVGGINEESVNKAIEILRIVCKAEIIKGSSIKVVETAKVFENVQRDVNIAMSQEFARFTEALGIDIFEVIRLANTHKRVNLLLPGSGVGGYCIPNAYYYLVPKIEEYKLNMGLVKLAREKNDLIPEFIINKTEELLKKVGKKIEKSYIGVFGLAMKDFSNDDRISPSVNICKLLTEKGAKVKAFDPIVETKYEFKVETQEEAVKDCDALLILTKQEGIDFKELVNMVKKMKGQPICIDLKGVIKRSEALKHGILYWRI